MLESALMKGVSGYPAEYPIEYTKLLNWFDTNKNGQRYNKHSIGDTIDTIGGNYQYCKVMMSTPSGDMIGSPLNSVHCYSTSSVIGRVIQHCFPDQKSFDYNVNKGFLVGILAVTFNSRTSMTGVSKNGYSSLLGNAFYAITEVFIYYDPTLDKIMKYNPRSDKNVEFDFA